MPLQATSGAASYDAFGGGVAAVPNYIEDVFSTWLYTGNGATQTITNGIDLAGKGGLVWLKARNAADYVHRLYDTDRGTGTVLFSNLTNAATAATNQINSFNSNGFTLGTNLNTNDSSINYASWTFRKQPKFFDVVTFTTGSSGTYTFNHNLGSVPGCVLIKSTGNASDWNVYHQSIGVNSRLFLNKTNAKNDYTGLWGTPTSTTFTGDIGTTLEPNQTHVAYLFAHNAGGFGLTGTDNVISCGSYTGTGAVGNAVALGYEPQWLMVKKTTSATQSDWVIFDNMRGWPVAGSADQYLWANSSNAEGSASTGWVSPNATGFQFDDGQGRTNGSGETYIYIAIRRGPMKVPTLGTTVYTSASRTGTAGVMPRWVAGFPVDWALRKSDVTTGGGDWQAGDRLRGAVQVKPNLTEAETSASPLYIFDGMTGYSTLGAAGSDTADRSWMFRRAPGFFDEVCYTGTGSATTFAHNLAVVPELMIVKERSSPAGWWWNVYYGTANKFLKLNTTDAETTSTAVWNNTAPTSSVFSVGAYNPSNTSGSTYVAYLFATCPGVSKVFSFTGNGSTQTINCGFTGGARFVLLKASSATGGWYVYDTARGMTTLTDPYLQLNSTAAESATLGSVTTVTTGFAVNESVLAGVNTNGVSYIGLAIA